MDKRNVVLTKKQREFCEAYVENGYNGAQAYKAVFNPSTSDSAKAAACALLAKPKIRNYIALLQKEYLEKQCISAERVLLKLGEIAFSEWDTFTTTAQLKALELIQKQLGLQKQNIKAEVDNTVEINVNIEE